MLPLALDLISHLQQRDYHDSITIQQRITSSTQNTYLDTSKAQGSSRSKFDGDSDAGLIRYSDSDWGENRDDHHSTSGHVFLMASSAISWTSQRQKTVALSVGEAEYMELASTG